MTAATSGRGRAVLISPSRRAEGDPIATLRVSAAGNATDVHLPYAAALRYVVVPRRGAAITSESDDFQSLELGPLATLGAALRSRLFVRRKSYLEFRDFRIFAIGPKAARKTFTAVCGRMRKSGVAIDGPIVARFPELLIGWRPEGDRPPAPRPHAGAPAFAVVAHVYYEDTWPEIAEALRRVAAPFDLIVTTVEERKFLVDMVLRDFPEAEIHVMENRGRDVRPFLALLQAGRLDRYSAVCKIHGKKSSDGGRQAALGAIWRRRMIFDQLGAPDAVAAILDSFERDSHVGMIGSAAYRYPSPLCNLERSWGENRPNVLALAAKMGVPPERYRLDFFCGSMFWARPEALRPLRDLNLVDAFEPEIGKLDGALENAVERLFATSAVVAGFRLDGVDGFALQAPQPARVGARETNQPLARAAT